MTRQPAQPPSGQAQTERRTAFFVLLGALAFVFLESFILPGIPLLPIGDQSIFLLNGARMLSGQVVYRDFFEFVVPGTDTVYFLLFKLCGVHAWIPGATLILLGAGLAWLSIFISRKVISGFSAFLPAILFLTFAFQTALDATHHWFSTLAAMIALAVIVESRSAKRLAAAGALCGLAAWFTQSEGLVVAAGFVVFLFWEHRRNHQSLRWLARCVGSLLAGFATTVVLLNAYFVWKAGAGRYIYCTVTYVLKYYSADWFNTWRVYMAEHPSVHQWSNWPELGVYLSIHFLLPLVYLLFFVRYWREAPKHPCQPWDRLMLVNLAGLFMFLGIATAPSVLRLCAVSPPAFITLVWLAKFPGKLERLLLRALWVSALVLVILFPVMRQTQWRAYLNLPTGRTAFIRPALYHEYEWLLPRARVSDFLFGDQPANFALRLRDPARVDFIRPTDYTRPSQVQDVVEGLERRRVRFVTWYYGLDRGVAGDPAGDHLNPLRLYLRRHYHVAKRFDRYHEILERNE